MGHAGAIAEGAAGPASRRGPESIIRLACPIFRTSGKLDVRLKYPLDGARDIPVRHPIEPVQYPHGFSHGHKTDESRLILGAADFDDLTR